MAEKNIPESYLQTATVLPHLELTTGIAVGDFGVGGAGYFAIQVAKKVGPNGSVIMFDIQKSSLSAALGQCKLVGLQNCKIVWSNLEIYGGAKGVPDGSLDAGLLINVLSQSKKYKDILAEVGRMLKPGAKLLVVDWLSEAEMTIAPEKSSRLPAEHIEQAAQALGFAPYKRFPAGRYHWGLVLVKT